MRKLLMPLCFCLFLPVMARAETICGITDRLCVIENIVTTAPQIENTSWRDQTYREAAKTLAADGHTDRAIALIDKIETPDTKAMTIRGIGMEAAHLDLDPESYTALFTNLRAEAEKIKHPPSYAIALTYIAMAQAFAGDNEGAWKTASEMENEALRHKAYGETAEIQAEKGNYTAALQSIEFIESKTYRDKSFALTSKIFANKDQLQEALDMAYDISNPYKKADALLYILNIKNKDKDRD